MKKEKRDKLMTRQQYKNIENQPNNKQAERRIDRKEKESLLDNTTIIL